MATTPILNVWIYNPSARHGKRFWVDPVLMPRYRLYHSTAWLGRDGSIYIAGGDQAVAPNNRWVPGASICLPVCLPFCLSVSGLPLKAPSIWPGVTRPWPPTISGYQVHLSTCLSVCLLFCLSVSGLPLKAPSILPGVTRPWPPAIGGWHHVNMLHACQVGVSRRWSFCCNLLQPVARPSVTT